MEKLIPTCIKEAIERNIRKQNEGEQVDPPTNSEPTSPPQEQPTGSAEPIENPAPLQPTTPQPTTTPNNDYPQIVGAEPSMYEVKLIKWLASSPRDSEFTAINNYLYQYFILKDTYPEVANRLREISQDEMEHYELLSEAIVDFGGNPNLTDGRGNVWTGRSVATIRNVRDILIFDIAGEEKAIKTYECYAQKTRNQSLADLFFAIANDEREHAEELKQLLANIDRV